MLFVVKPNGELNRSTQKRQLGRDLDSTMPRAQIRYSVTGVRRQLLPSRAFGQLLN